MTPGIAWFARGFLYIGMAGFSRVSCPAVSGLVCRLFEHLTLRARSHCPQSRLHRYKLARRVPLTSMMWLPVRQGHECEIRARECVAIKMFNPCGNVVHSSVSVIVKRACRFLGRLLALLGQ